MEDALAELANDPSSRRLEQARTRLQTFRSQFAGWMHLQALTEDYRVQTWENRLATLENLLNYGERVVLEQDSDQAALENPQ
ncbi:MAG: hypothetical protein HC769_07705 [Cyanobacteria bacterium CRU_2_1]|nr:hypothetical protein [Cyanobacteria bacterium CRU_2_1]